MNRSDSICEGRALVWIDMEPLLSQEREASERLEIELDRAKEELESFRCRCKPDFYRWLQEIFGERQLSLNSLKKRAQELQLIVDSVESYASKMGCSKRDAYSQITRTRAGSAFLEEVRFKQSQAEPPPPPGEAGEPSRYDEADPKEEEAPAEDQAEELRLKDLFRELARRLHPDLNSCQSEKERELWHEAKCAYRAGDLAALEALATRRSPSLLKTASLSQLRQIRQKLQASLEALREEISEARKDRAWAFSETRNSPEHLQELENRILTGMERENEIALSQIKTCERQIARWKPVRLSTKASLPKKRETPPQLNLFGSTSH